MDRKAIENKCKENLQKDIESFRSSEDPVLHDIADSKEEQLKTFKILTPEEVLDKEQQDALNEMCNILNNLDCNK